MVSIQPVPDGPEDSAPRDAARLLFREYEQFLRESGSAEKYNLARLAKEIETIPTAYSNCGGEVLLASHRDSPAGCIAYRDNGADALLPTCEIKRLYVRPAFRSLGIGRELLVSAMERAARRGFALAQLDTDPATMPAALRVYQELGFTEYKNTVHPGADTLIFLERPLP